MAVLNKDNATIWKAIGSQVVTCTVRTEEAVVYDLTGLTVTVSGTLDSVDQFRDLACTLDADPTTGVFTFTPSAGELANAGVYDCQAKITNGSAVALTYPFTLTVEVPV